MTKPVRLRAVAADDVLAATDHYIHDAGKDVAGRFVDAVERAVQQIGRHPHSGSLRFSYELDLPELGAWPLARFPYLVFYVERENDIDVWRVLHTRRDVPTTPTRPRTPAHQLPMANARGAPLPNSPAGLPTMRTARRCRDHRS